MRVDGSQVSAREGPRCFSPSGPAPLVRDCTAFPLPVARSSAASGAFGGAAVTSSPGLSALRASSKILRWPSPTHAAPGSSERSPQTQRPREAPSASTPPSLSSPFSSVKPSRFLESSYFFLGPRAGGTGFFHLTHSHHLAF